MSNRVISIDAELGSTWLHDQMARLRQRHRQFGQRWHLDVDALLARAARMAREAQALQMSAWKSDRIRRATIEAVEHCINLRG